MDDRTVRETLQYIDFLWSITLFIFFMYQRVYKNRCKFEVLYVSGVGSITDLVKIAFTDYTPASITIKENDVSFNWSQFYGWLVTCPVLLIHLSNLAGKDVFDVRRMMKILVAYQILMVSGATASMCDKDNPFKWIFFVMAITCLSIVYRYALQIFKESITIMPEAAEHTIKHIATIFYISWSGFGMFWFIGPSGVSFVSNEVSKAGFAFFDIMSKNVYSMFGWYLRWYILRKHDNPEEFVNQKEEDEENIKQFSVLLVEQNPIYTHYFIQILQQLNCDVLVVSNINEILIYTSKQTYDMMFINYDIAMFNNYEIMFGIRKYLYMLPVIAYGGHNIDPMIIENRQVTGIDDFIITPFPDNIIKKKIVQWSRRASIIPQFVTNQKYDIQMKMNIIQQSINEIKEHYAI